jgi:hypothetical protein
LQGLSGYRTPEERAYLDFQETRPTAPGAPAGGGKKSNLLTAGLGLGLGGITGAGAVLGIGGKKKKKKAAAQAAAAQADYESKLAAWQTQADQLKVASDTSLQGYSQADATKRALEATPGYQYRYETGLGAVGSRQAARNAMLGGGALKELTKYGQDFATNEYGNEINRLSNLAGMGERSAQALSSISVGQGAGQAGLSLGNAAANSAYYGDINSVLQGSLGNYMAWQQRPQNQQNPYASSFGTPVPTYGTDYGE